MSLFPDPVAEPAAAAPSPPSSGPLIVLIALLLVAMGAVGFLLAERRHLQLMPGTTATVSTPIAAPAGAPVGAVVAYAGSLDATLDGWLACDGRELACADYPELCAAIGRAHGGDVETGTFRVPDLRGRFVRGVDGGAERDPERDDRDPPAFGGNAGDKVGSIQDDRLASHDHAYQRFRLKDADWQRGVKHHFNGTGDLAQGARTSTTGGGETRPKNVYLNWLIRSR